jgi:hypothetical protein
MRNFVYRLPASPAMPQYPDKNMEYEELLEWARQLHSTVQDMFIMNADRTENQVIVSEDGSKPDPSGLRQLLVDISVDTPLMYIDNYNTATDTPEWLPLYDDTKVVGDIEAVSDGLGALFESPLGDASLPLELIGSEDAPTYNGDALWHEGNDGPGSGLDADTLDGLQAAAFANAAHDHDADYADISHDHDGTYAELGDLPGGANPLIMNNNVAIFGKDSGGTARPMLYMSGSNSSVIGNGGVSLALLSSAARPGFTGSGGYDTLALTGDIPTQASDIGAAGDDHNHDSDYASISHDHDADYADISHNHTGVYAATSHTHGVSDITSIPAARIVGRANGAGTGAGTALTAAQVIAALTGGLTGQNASFTFDDGAGFDITMTFTGGILTGYSKVASGGGS